MGDHVTTLWAKAGNGTEVQFHPLVCHMADTAAVATVLWEEVLAPALQQQVSEAFGLPSARAGAVVAFWAGAHDLGKATPGFQGQVQEARVQLLDAGFAFPSVARVPHGHLTTRLLQAYSASSASPVLAPSPLNFELACIIGGHHGVFPTALELGKIPSAALGSGLWEATRTELLEHLKTFAGLAGQTLQVQSADALSANAALMILSGLISVADWIASCAALFPYAGLAVDLEAYLASRPTQARQALERLGWFSRPGLTAPETFEALFGLPPRPLQAAAERLADQDGPVLALIEAPMGEGKTEAAFFLADHWNSQLGQAGLYVGLPTQATSNAMFTRLRDFLAKRHPDARLNLQLQHSHAALQDDFSALRLAAVAQDTGVGDTALVAEEWFTPRKRGLLAPFGVGTVDQALLAVLQTRHVFVRLFGLAHKTVIIDEVHAYDTYMSALLDRLLEWLSALGSSVVLLSATLPRRRRQELLAAYGGSNASPGDAVYPRLSIASAHQATAESFAASRSTTIQLRQVPESLPALLAAQLADGGCAAVICNTVGRAQEVFGQLRQTLGSQGITVELFHARFPFGQRSSIEARVVAEFGKGAATPNPCRPRAAVLVATQVVEQSLDLDFDVMLSELAPVDLLLQRAGRLHRHAGTLRPAPLCTPTLWLLPPEKVQDGVPDFGSSQWVYDRHILLRTHLLLLNRTQLSFPADIEPLVNALYDAPPPMASDAVWHQALAESRQDLEDKRRDSGLRARRFLIGRPEAEDGLLQDFCQQLEEDNPQVARNLQANTRDAEPSLTVVCLHRRGEGIYLDPAATRPVDLAVPPDRALTAELLRAAVSLSHPRIVAHLAAQEVPPGWRKNALLRHARPLFFNVAATATVAGQSVRLDEALGLVLGPLTTGGNLR